MLADKSLPKRQSRDFLGEIAILSERAGKLVRMEAHYAVELYDRSLFDAHNIDFPHKLTRAVPKRLSEFLAGRVLACAALEMLHHPGASIAIGEQGAPIWPNGVSGSISHSHGRCACLAVADDTALVGIDIEKVATDASLQAVLQESVSGVERDRIFHQKMFDPSILATLIFSAKETLYKALYPVVLNFFGFDAAVFNGLHDARTLSLSVVHALHDAIPRNQEILIQFEIDGEFVRTWAILEHGTLHSFC